MKSTKLISIGLCITLSITTFITTGNYNIALAAEKTYDKALQYAVQFYDANKCGKEVGTNNYFSWRKSCHVQDGKDLGIDLSGGYHDCGDHVKFCKGWECQMQNR